MELCVFRCAAPLRTFLFQEEKTMKFFKAFLFTTVTLLLVLSLFACAPKNNSKNVSDGFYYHVNEDGKTCTITGIDNDTNTGTDLVIPNTLKRYTVTNIGKEAFQHRSFTSVVIPDSVTSIGADAFYNCTSLTKVVISDIAAWCNISFSYSPDNPLSYAKHLYLGENEITELVIPDGVTSIGDYAFYWCTSLTSVVIPDSVTEIGDSAFFSCASLTSVVIGDSVTSIGWQAFYNCTSLTSVVIPDSVTSIGDGAFYWCTSLTSIQYRGTQEQWNAISKGVDWNYNTGNYTVTYNYTGD